MLLETEADIVELLVNLRHCLLEGSEMCVLRALGCVVERVRGTDTCNHVLTLSIDEPFSVELVVAVCRVAGEGYAGSGGLAHISEYHGLNVHCSAPVVRNTLDLAVLDGALSVPGLEHASDGTPELLLCGIRELHSENFLDAYLELLGEFLELLCGDLGVALVALGLLEVFHHLVELLAYCLAVLRLDALCLLHHDVGIHHYETAIGVIYETWVVGLLDHSRDSGGAETDVEDGIHHARHRAPCTGTAADEKRILGVAELHSHDLLGGLECLGNLFLKFLGVAAAELVILGTAFGGDGETCRHRHSEKVHLGQVCTLAAEEFPHRAVAFSLTGTEAINSFFVLFHCSYC